MTTQYNVSGHYCYKLTLTLLVYPTVKL